MCLELERYELSCEPLSLLPRFQVSSIRAKFTRRSPDGASDDYNVESSDRNV